MEKINVLFVCMANICRSPAAEGVFVKLIKDRALEGSFRVDSAGTHAYHEGEVPDARTQQSALLRDVKLAHLRARKVVMGDFEDFDYVVRLCAIGGIAPWGRRNSGALGHIGFISHAVYCRADAH